MSANKPLADMMKRLGTKGVQAGSEPTPAPEEPLQEIEDEWEELDGSGRTSKHPVLGVQFIDGDRMLAWIPYAAMLWAEGDFNGRRVKFEAERANVLYEVVIEGEGPGFQAVADKLMEGKRLTVRVNAGAVTAISVRGVPKAKG
jgi:hypothetical protein